MLQAVARFHIATVTRESDMYQRLKNSYGTRLAFLIFATLVAAAILGIRKVCGLPSQLAGIIR